MRFALAIAYGASVGGILTPIGTPPNLILLGIMQNKGMEAIPFFQWIWMVIPLAFIMLIIVSLVLSLGVENTPIQRDKKKHILDTNQKKSFISYWCINYIFACKCTYKNHIGKVLGLMKQEYF